MFDAAEIGSEVSKEAYEAREPELRIALINAQYDLKDAPFSVLVLLSGDDRQGCVDVLSVIHEWMDTRHIITAAFSAPNAFELAHPRFWRYWLAMPRHGQMAIFHGAWANHAVADRVLGNIDDNGFTERVEHVRRLEHALADDETLLLKFWIHLPKKEHKKRLEKAEKDPSVGWRTEEDDWRIYERYDEGIPVAAELLRRTDEAETPWKVVEGTNARYRNLAVMETLLAALRERLDRPAASPPPGPAQAPAARPAAGGPSVLATVDLGRSIDYDDYKKKLGKAQAELRQASVRVREKGVPAVVVLEGWDAAGKGGVIRRVTRALDPRDYRVTSISAPTDEERKHHYLWRFWRRLPRPGHIAIFDRSWYGRVLVERVEGFATAAEWRRAYAEINEFESQLLESGAVVLKFWLHIDQEEQMRRFQAREKTPYKKYKISDEDYRNRQHWDDYVAAVDEMVERTSTRNAPWQLVPANDKRYARLQVVETLAQELGAAKGRS